jgi:hypothetical protein
MREVLKHFDAPWIVAASRSLPSPGEFLWSLVEEPWLTPQAKTLLMERAVEAYREQSSTAVGEARDSALAQYSNAFGRYLDHLIESGDLDRAQVAAASLPRDARERLRWVLEPLGLYVAARAGRLPKLIEAWQAGDEGTPSEDVLRQVAMRLRQMDSAASARQLLRFHYERALQRQSPPASEFLGLAEIMLEEGDTSGAVAQLRRMNLVTEPAFVHLAPAAALLRRFQKEAEAREFAEMSAKALPWVVQPAPQAPAATLAQATAAVRTNPDDPEQKLPLFRLARAAGQWRLALNALAPLTGYPIRPWFDADIHEESGQNHYAAQQFLADRQLSAAERAGVARDASECFDRIGMLSSAVAMRQVAQMIQGTAADSAWIADRRRELARRKTNLDRIPYVSENLEQPRQVRPRLVRQ